MSSAAPRPAAPHESDHMRRTIRRLLTGAVVAALLTGGTTLPASAAPPSEREMSPTSFTSPLVFQNPAGGYIAYSSGPEQGGITRFRDFRATTHATYAQAAGSAVSVVLPDPGAGPAEVKLPGGECITTLDGAGPGRTLTASKSYCNTYGYTWSVTNDGRVVSTLGSTGMGPTQAAQSAYWPFTGLRPFITGGGYALGGSRFEVPSSSESTESTTSPVRPSSRVRRPRMLRSALRGARRPRTRRPAPGRWTCATCPWGPTTSA
jgi:hypothetical protein